MPRLDVEVGGCYLVRSSDPETAEVAACGGAVTELLRYALEEGLSDVAVCVERGADVLDGRPVVVDDPSEVPSGSYHCAPVQLARIVAELHREDPTLRVTVTCRPCDARALERLAERDLVDLNRMHRIGLNCGGTFEPWVVLEILEEHGVDPSNVEREEIVGASSWKRRTVPRSPSRSTYWREVVPDAGRTAEGATKTCLRASTWPAVTHRISAAS